jgi:hypothetical protein
MSDGGQTAQSKPDHPLLRFVHGLLHWAEVFIAFCAMAVVVYGVVKLSILFFEVKGPDSITDFFKLFEEMLSALLLLVVGIELAIMLVLRRPESLLEIMFFVIARKVLIKTHHVYELLIAVVAIAILFAIKKYLMANDTLLLDTGRSSDPDDR